MDLDLTPYPQMQRAELRPPPAPRPECSATVWPQKSPVASEACWHSKDLGVQGQPQPAVRVRGTVMGHSAP